MNKKSLNLVILFTTVILIFVIGFRYEIDYRILTRKLIKYLAKYKIDYYGGKEFRIFETDIAFILILIPISFFLLTKNLKLYITKIKYAFLYLSSIIGFYCLYCYIESEFIRITVTSPNYQKGALMYHYNNISYRGILFFTIFSTFTLSIIIKKFIKKASI